MQCMIMLYLYIYIYVFIYLFTRVCVCIFFCTSFLLLAVQENICLKSLFLWNTHLAANLAVTLISPLTSRVRE